MTKTRQWMKSTFDGSRQLPQFITIEDATVVGPFCTHCGGDRLLHSKTGLCPTTVPPIFPPPCCGCHGTSKRPMEKEDIDVLRVLEAVDDMLEGMTTQHRWAIHAGIVPGGIYVSLWTVWWDRYVDCLVAPFWKSDQERDDYLGMLMKEVQGRVAEVDSQR